MKNISQTEERPAQKAATEIAPMRYRAGVRGSWGLDVVARVAVFEVDESLARDIVKFALLVKANDVYKIERFDYRAQFLQHDPDTSPEEAESAGQDNVVSTECDCVIVTDDSFFFSACVKHTDVTIECFTQPVSVLAQHFGLQFLEAPVEGTGTGTVANEPGCYSDTQLSALLEALVNRLALSSLQEIVDASAQCWHEQLNGNGGSQRDASEVKSMAIRRGVAAMISHDKEVASRLIDRALR